VGGRNSEGGEECGGIAVGIGISGKFKGVPVVIGEIGSCHD